jgi:transposase
MNDFLSYCNKYPTSNSVIIIDNASIHCDLSIADAIRIQEYLIRYLPPYSSNYNPIKLSFSILKSWIRRRFYKIWPFFENSFGDFLIECVINNRCNRFGEAHFRHNNNRNYIFNGDLETFDR